MVAVTPWSMASAWWEQESTRAVVLLLTALASLDSGYTLLWISQRGLIGETNPLIRSLFQASLGQVWLVGNVLATFLGAVFLGSCVVTLRDESRAYPALGMSLLAALKVVLGLYHLIQFYDIIELTWILWITAVATFLGTRQLLNKGRLIDLKRAFRGLRELRNEFSTFMIMSHADKVRPNVETSIKPIPVSVPRNMQDRTSVLRNWRLFFWVGVIILTPILALSIVELLLQMSGVLDLPRWMRGLGMVSQEQGRLFFLSLISILLTIAILIYSIVAVFEILSGETTTRKKSERRRGNQDSLTNIFIASSCRLCECCPS